MAIDRSSGPSNLRATRQLDELEQRNLQNYLSAKAAFNDQNLALCMTFYAPDHHIRSLAVAPGRQHIEAFLSSLHEQWSDLTVVVERTITQGDWLAGWCTVTAVHSRTTHGIAATFKPVTTTFWEMHRFNHDGQIAESWNLIDSAAVLQQLGLLPAAP